MTPTLTEELVTQLRRPVGDEARALAALYVLDWAATAVAAVPTREGTILRHFAAAGANGPAQVIGFGRREVHTAAFVNAGLALVLEMDGTHRRARLHPGPVVIAAAFALAEEQGATGADFLDAVVRGYEAMIRVGEAMGAAHYRFFHPTSTCGPFGAAAAAASLLGLDEDQWVHALGNAGSLAGGVWQCRPERAMSKVVHVGEAASRGIRVSRLAQLGLTGPRRILEGELGLFAAGCPDAMPEAVMRPAATPWKIGETSLKPWPGCRHAHPAVDAALRLRHRLRALGEDVGEVDRVEVSTYPEALEFADQPEPRSTSEALFSVQHLVAVALLTGEPTIEDVAARRIDDPQLTAVRARVRVSAGDTAYAAAYPDHWGASVSVAWGDRRYEEMVRDAKGDPESPMSHDEVVAKAVPLLARVGMSESAVDALVAATAALPVAPDVCGLAAALPDLARRNP